MAAIDPSVLVAPDYQTQMMQAQHRLALAQQLQQMSMQDTPGNGGTVSWTQGLARLADALVGGIAAKKGYKEMQGANQAYAAGLRGMFGQPPQAPQAAPQGAQPVPQPPMPPSMPQGGSPAPQGAPADPLAPLPDAPPQAAPPPPAAAPMPPQGGAPSAPWSLTGNPQRDMALYMSNPEEFGKAMIANAAKGGAPTDTEIMMQHARAAAAQGDYQTAAMLQAQAQKAGYIEPTNVRQGSVILDPQTHRPMFYNPTMDKGITPTWGPNGVPQSASALPGYAQANAGIEATEKGAVAGATTPFQTTQRFNPQTNQMETVPLSSVTGGYNPVKGGYFPGAGRAPSGPAIGKQSAYDTYGKQSADAFMETQGIANSSPQRVQSLREMESLINGPGALNTGPTATKVQQMAEDHGMTFLAKDNAFVFNKDAARFVAQSAQDLGLNGSDQRLGMMANASPNMKMTPQALKTVIPTMIGLEYAKMGKAAAAANWAQSKGPDTNAQFETAWRQNYDPRMFTAYAQGGPQALAHAPTNLRQQWLRDYRNLKGMGVSFTQFAQ